MRKEQACPGEESTEDLLTSIREYGEHVTAELAADRAENQRRKATFLAHGQCFALGREDRLLVLYIEDDTWWHEVTRFDPAWLPEIEAVVKRARRKMENVGDR